MDRRSFVDTVGRAAAALSVGDLMPRDVRPVPPKLTLVALGDLILTRRVSLNAEAAFQGVVGLLRSADCTWGNCEMNIIGPDTGYPMSKGRDGTVIAPPWAAEELAWMGINFLGMANNHTCDYGEAAVLETLDHVERAGMGTAGSGEDLQRASRPGYVDTRGGRVAQVSCASTFPHWSAAAPTTPFERGRPGLNPLRVRRTYQLRSDLLEGLRAAERGVAEASGQDRPDDDAPAGRIRFLGTDFVEGSTNDTRTEAVEEDLTRVTDAVRIARRNARVVIVSIHAHERYRKVDTPARFLQPFARSCIDAGADAFFGSGPHLLRPLEIYRGKPIFYSLGNFVFQYETVERIGADELIANDLDPRTRDLSLAFDNFRFPEDRRYWETVVPFVTVEGDRRVTELRLHPVLMGQDEPRHYRGTPVLASGEDARSILERFARLSAPYDTQLEIRDGVGYVRL